MITAYQELATVYVIMGANIKVVGIKRVVPFPRELVDQKQSNRSTDANNGESPKFLQWHNTFG